MKSWAFWALVILGLVLLFNPKKPNIPYLPYAAVDERQKRAVPYDLPPAAPAPQASKPGVMTYGGYPCSDDCSRHRKGYLSAENNGIIDPDSCTGDSGAFAEGCRVYAAKRLAKTWNR